MNPQELCDIIVKILEERKGDDIAAIDVAHKTTLADYFVLASANTSLHVKALADELSLRLKDNYGIFPVGVEGAEAGRWTLLDYGSVVVHLMHRTERDFYKLDAFWTKERANTLLVENLPSE